MTNRKSYCTRSNTSLTMRKCCTHGVCTCYIRAHWMRTQTTLCLSNFFICLLIIWRPLMSPCAERRVLWRWEKRKIHTTCLRVTYFTPTSPNLLNVGYGLCCPQHAQRKTWTVLSHGLTEWSYNFVLLACVPHASLPICHPQTRPFVIKAKTESVLITDKKILTIWS